jgi:hypothetical protein
MLLLLATIFVFLYISSINKNMVYIYSDIDNKSYLVRDLPDKQRAANILARLKLSLIRLSDYMYDKKDTIYNEYSEYITRLGSKIKYVDIQESTAVSMYTSYSVNKGEQIIFCLREKSFSGNLHDVNLVMYVALHEIAHIACPEYGHTELFKKIFAFFVLVAIDIGIYKKIYFNDDPVNYCGLTITESII